MGKDWGKVPSDISYTVASSSGSADGESPKNPDGGVNKDDGGRGGGGGGEIGYKWFVLVLTRIILGKPVPLQH